MKKYLFSTGSKEFSEDSDNTSLLSCSWRSKDQHMREVARSALGEQDSEKGGFAVSKNWWQRVLKKQVKRRQVRSDDGMKARYQLLEMGREIGVVVEFVEVCWSVLVYPKSHCECVKERSG